MLSNEMTTGSVNSSDAQKSQFASRSHAWNLEQARFKEAFPDFCGQFPKELPNMGDQRQRQQQPHLPPPTPPTFATTSTPTIPTAPENSTSDALKPKATTKDDPTPGAAETAISWGQILWDKWRWGVLIALAVVVSRLSSART
jgi:ubiquitin-conjugating enzyme E2 J2